MLPPHDPPPQTGPERPPGRVPWREFWGAWARVAALSFGGPAGQIAVMHRVVVDELRWVTEDRFLHALNFCMLLPGPEAQQLATYLGWLMRGPRGALVAGGLFVLPGFVSILALSLLYVYGAEWPVVQGLFYGLKPAVLAIVLGAVLRIGRRALRTRAMLLVAGAAFVGLFFLGAPFPLVVVSAACAGYFGERLAPGAFAPVAGHARGGNASDADGDDPAPRYALPMDGVRPTLRRSSRVLATGLAVWGAPLVTLNALLGPQSVYFQQAVFFSQAALVTFGGAYAVMSYLAQQAVERFGWVTPGEMLDGLGMAETTPGPLIQVVQFVGFMGAWRAPAPFSPLAGALLASVVVTWVTYAPCFLWILLGAPYVERLRSRTRLTAALSAVTSAVVGVILNLAVWFALHTLFGTVHTWRLGPVRLSLPAWETLDPWLTLLTVGACWAVAWRGLSPLMTLAACAAAGVLLKTWG